MSTDITNLPPRILKPKQAINKAYRKVKPNRSQIETFKTNLKELLDRINDTESEEFHKNLLIDFLKKTYYEPNHFMEEEIGIIEGDSDKKIKH